MKRSIVALALLGCGGSDVTYTCTLMNVNAAQCTEYRVPVSKANLVSQTCAAEHGTIVKTSCADKDSFGVCSDLSSNGIDYTVWVYPSAGVPDAGTAQAYCAGVLQGTWTSTKRAP